MGMQRTRVESGKKKRGKGERTQREVRIDGIEKMRTRDTGSTFPKHSSGQRVTHTTNKTAKVIKDSKQETSRKVA